MWQTIWDFISDKNNREAVGWLAAGAVSVVGAIASLRKALKDKPQTPPPKATRSSSRSSQTVRISNVRGSAIHVGDRRGVPIVAFIVFALFAAFALGQIAEGSAPARAECARDLSLPADHQRAADALNKRGIYYGERGDRRKALQCFLEAQRKDARNWAVAENVVMAHLRLGQDQDALRESAILVQRQIQAMIGFEPDLRAVGHLSCNERLVFTREGFSTKPWIFRLQSHARRGDLDAAVAEADQVLASYARSSCLWPRVADDWSLTRASLICASGDIARATPLFEAARSALSHPDIARDQQRMLQELGLYTGDIDGRFGSGSHAALNAWISQGCPGYRERLANLYY